MEKIRSPDTSSPLLIPQHLPRRLDDSVSWGVIPKGYEQPAAYTCAYIDTGIKTWNAYSRLTYNRPPNPDTPISDGN